MLKYIYNNALLLAITWTMVIFGLCCMPGQYIPTNNWLELLSFDKFVHASIFFGMVSLWLVFLHHKQKLSTINVLIVLLICILYGGLLEIMQATVFSQRSADWQDFIANSFGCVVAYYFFVKKQHLLSEFNK